MSRCRRGDVPSLGAQLVAREAYRYVVATKGSRPQGWQSPSAELQWPGAALMAATLTSDPASGGDLVVPQFLPGIVPSPTRRLTIADLLASGTTESNLITSMRETGYTNAADTVAEGTTKPESTLTFDAVSDPVRKIADWLSVTEEMLEDVPSLRSYLDVRLRLGGFSGRGKRRCSRCTVTPCGGRRQSSHRNPGQRSNRSICFDDLRHEGRSRPLEAGWPLHHVQHMLGHVNLAQASTCMNATRIGLHESIRRFEVVAPVAIRLQTGTASTTGPIVTTGH